MLFRSELDASQVRSCSHDTLMGSYQNRFFATEWSRLPWNTPTELMKMTRGGFDCGLFSAKSMKFRTLRMLDSNEVTATLKFTLQAVVDNDEIRSNS